MVGRQVLEGAPGVQVVDDRAANQHPEPLLASNQENILVGRVRYDNTQGTPEDGYTGIEVSSRAVMTRRDDTTHHNTTHSLAGRQTGESGGTALRWFCCACRLHALPRRDMT